MARPRADQQTVLDVTQEPTEDAVVDVQEPQPEIIEHIFDEGRTIYRTLKQ